MSLLNSLKRLFKKQLVVSEKRPFPKNGERIEITWLPPNNVSPNPNCYVGAKGVVEDCDSDGFVLRYDSGALLVISGECAYKILSN